MYACLQKQVTYVATVFNTSKNLGDDTCVNKSIDYIVQGKQVMFSRIPHRVSFPCIQEVKIAFKFPSKVRDC